MPSHDGRSQRPTGTGLAQVRTLQEIVDRATGQMAFTMVLLVIAASVALLLGVIGVYGVSVLTSSASGPLKWRALSAWRRPGARRG